MTPSFPGPYQLSKLPLAKIKKLVEENTPDDAFLKILAGDSRAGVKALADKIVREREKTARLRKRQEELAALENELRKAGKRCIAGVDEAGRGPLAGPVVAAAVVLPEGFDLPGIDDSKKLSAERREELFDAIITQSVSWGVGIVDNTEIDMTNILDAAMKAMRAAVKTMRLTPDIVLVDGNRSPGFPYEERLIVDGDARCRVIGAASIIAKVTRDRIMTDLDKQFPGYGFKGHKGYGAETHIAAIRKHGPCDIHRISFRIVPAVAPDGTVAAVLRKRLMNAPNRETFTRTVAGITRIRDSIHRRDLAILRDVFRECAKKYRRTR